jgi:RNA polymerase sigma-70 factor (ECF subfamily)
MPAPVLSFEAVHREFQAKVLRYLAGFVDADEAADLAQVTMIKVSEHLPEFRGESSLSTWIYRIATNVALDRLRQRSPDRVAIGGEPDAEDDDLDENVPAQLQAPSAETAAMRNEMSGCVREFVDRLPASYRSILVLSDIEGLTNGEIAEITGLSLDTVKIRLHRARIKLRAELRAGCSIERDERNELACDRRPPILPK